MPGSGQVRLYVARHADALPATTTDKARELSDTGLRRARELGEQLASVRFDMVIASDATRAAQSLAAIEDALQDAPGEREVAESHYQAGVSDWLARLRQLDDSCSTVLLVGHNPSLTTLVCLLAADATINLSAGDCAVLAGDVPWPALVEGSMRVIDRLK